MFSSFFKSKRGFTLVELLLVISIIGLFSSIIISTFKQIRHKANATRICEDFKTIETALNMFMSDNNNTSWPLENTWHPVRLSNPFMSHLITSNLTNFDDYLSQPPIPPEGVSEYFYDNDGDSHGMPCDGGQPWRGVNISLQDISTTTAAYVEEMFDDNDGWGCGKIRISTVPFQINYVLSTNSVYE